MFAKSLFDLTGRKALVTGGASGIGRSCALALADAGADVAIVDLDTEVGGETVRRVREIGRESLFVHCDVSKSNEVQFMVDAFVRLKIPRATSMRPVLIHACGVSRAVVESRFFAGIVPFERFLTVSHVAGV